MTKLLTFIAKFTIGVILGCAIAVIFGILGLLFMALLDEVRVYLGLTAGSMRVLITLFTCGLACGIVALIK